MTHWRPCHNLSLPGVAASATCPAPPRSGTMRCLLHGALCCQCPGPAHASKRLPAVLKDWCKGVADPGVWPFAAHLADPSHSIARARRPDPATDSRSEGLSQHQPRLRQLHLKCTEAGDRKGRYGLLSCMLAGCLRMRALLFTKEHQ